MPLFYFALLCSTLLYFALLCSTLFFYYLLSLPSYLLSRPSHLLSRPSHLLSRPSHLRPQSTAFSAGFWVQATATKIVGTRAKTIRCVRSCVFVIHSFIHSFTHLFIYGVCFLMELKCSPRFRWEAWMDMIISFWLTWVVVTQSLTRRRR